MIRALNYLARALRTAGHRLDMLVLKLNVVRDTAYFHESLRPNVEDDAIDRWKRANL